MASTPSIYKLVFAIFAALGAVMLQCLAGKIKTRTEVRQGKFSTITQMQKNNNNKYIISKQAIDFFLFNYPVEVSLS